MAKKLSKTGISTSSTIQAWHVSQSVDALASPNADAYDIGMSGSVSITGSFNINAVPYPTNTPAEGEVIVADDAGNLTFGHGEKLHLQVRNDESVTIPAGTPIYSRGEIGGSERIKVGIASASRSDTMPALGITETELDTAGGKDGFAIINGVYNTNITPADTTGLVDGATLYVHANGYITPVKPTGSNLIQNIGTVLKTNGTVIQGMKVSSIDRTNDIPNITEGYAWVGNTDGVPVAVATSSIGGSPGGSNTQIQFNNEGAFGGASAVTYDQDLEVLTVDHLNSTAITASGAISSSYDGENTFAGLIYLANNRNLGGYERTNTTARPLILRNTDDETQLGSTHYPIRFGNYVSSSYAIKTTSTIEAVTGSFSYLTGSSPIVIDADNIKVDSAGNVSNIAAITASGAISGSGDLYGLDANNKLLALTEISISSGEPVTFDLPSSGTTFSAINLNSDATNRFAKITFVAPRSGNVRIEMKFNMIITNSSDKPLIGLHSSKTGTTQPDVGWFLIRSDEDAAPTDYSATFIKTGLTSGTSYSYYFMGLADFSSCTIRAGKQWTEAYDGTDANEYPGPIRIYAYDLGDITITSNPTG